MNKVSLLALLLLGSYFPPLIADDSTIVFMRSSMGGAMIKTSIYEVTGGETKFIGILKNKTKIKYKTAPGKRTFMVVSEAADFMEAEITAGKTYYSVITPRMGAWKARFSMVPVRNDGTTDFNTESKKFKKILNKSKLAALTEKSKKWYQKNKDSVESKKTKYWAKWQEKSAEEIASRTLNPDDGVPN